MSEHTQWTSSTPITVSNLNSITRILARQEVSNVTEDIVEEHIDPINVEIDNIQQDVRKLRQSLVGSKTSTGGEIFNSYTNASDNIKKNVALGIGSSARNVSTLAGCKGFYVKNIDFENQIIHLSSGLNDIPTTGTYDGATEDLTKYGLNQYVVGDHIDLTSNTYYHWIMCAEIVEVKSSEGWLRYKNMVDPDVKLQGIDRICYLSVNSKPEVGSVIFSYASSAEGYETKAAGQYSHAEGYGSISAGRMSHAEGNNTIAGYSSHAEGEGTKALGLVSHAEGGATVAKGIYSHAEGSSTKALGGHSHAEGGATISQGHQSHAEGSNTKAVGDYSHAEGFLSDSNGIASHAEGSQTKARGKYSHSEGYMTYANGQTSHAEGHQAVASGEASHAEGVNTSAVGFYSHAEGNRTSAINRGSHAEGYGTVASGDFSHAQGNTSQATNTGSHAEGYGTQASGAYSHAQGYMTIASNGYSHAEGYCTATAASNQHVAGTYNLISDQYLYILGNGTSKQRSNAFTIDTSGNATARIFRSSSGADYAEMFEWLDNNLDNEDRVGYVVSLENGKIRLANPTDDILGVVSSCAAVLGDTAEWEWCNKYQRDKFGRVLTEKVELFEKHLDVDTDEEIEVSIGFHDVPLLNPEYDSSKEYVRRENRAEWAAVGMLGKLYARDDGTCMIDGYACVAQNGILTASASKTNMRVISRASEDVVRVLLK